MPLIDDLREREEVRLFPSQKIDSVREAEIRATASLLSIARAVSEFGKRIVTIAGGPGGKISCYTEVPFKVQLGSNSREDRPDGIIQVNWGKKSWAAFVEVKVGNNCLQQDQIERYHSLALDRGVDCIITISNQSALGNGLAPGINLNAWKLKKVPIVHVSWERLLSEAQLLCRREEIADVDQHWMLNEWICFVDDPRSRIIELPQLGDYWHEVLRFAREGNLVACKNEMNDVVHRWDAFLTKVALRLRARLGADAKIKISRAEQADPATRIKNLNLKAISDGELSGVLSIPDAAGDVTVSVLLASRSVQYSVQVEAPSEGKAKTRINWMLRQLSDGIPPDLVVQVDWGFGRASQARIKDLEENNDCLMWDNKGEDLSSKSLPRWFQLKWTMHLPKGKARSTASVLEGIYKGLEDFYSKVVEGLRPYVPKAPQLPRERRQRNKQEDNGPEVASVASVEDMTVPLPQGTLVNGHNAVDQKDGNSAKVPEEQTVADSLADERSFDSVAELEDLPLQQGAQRPEAVDVIDDSDAMPAPEV